MEEEFISASGDFVPSDGEDQDDDHRHKNLLRGVASLSAKKRVGAPRSEPALRVSEFGFAPSDGRAVRLHELVGGLGQGSRTGALKKQLGRVGRADRVVAVPPNRTQLEQIHRVVGYEQAAKEVTVWEPVVEQNRKAKQQMFPLYQSDIRMLQTTAQFANTHQPRTPLELQVAALLSNNKAALPQGQGLSVSEELALRAKSLDEALARRADLQKERALLSYTAAKLKRQGKIKSKKYHRVQRKSRARKQEKALEELRLRDPEVYQQTLLRAHTQRIKERMSLKHKATSKFMKKQTIYGKHDAAGRQAVADMLQLGEELRQKQSGGGDSDSESGGEGSSGEDEVPPGGAQPPGGEGAAGNNPWMSGKPSKQRATIVTEKHTDVAAAKDAPGISGLVPDPDEFDIDEIFDNAAANSSNPPKMSANRINMAADGNKKGAVEKPKHRGRGSVRDGGEGGGEPQHKRMRRHASQRQLISSSSSEEEDLEDDGDGDVSEREIKSGGGGGKMAAGGTLGGGRRGEGVMIDPDAFIGAKETAISHALQIRSAADEDGGEDIDDAPPAGAGDPNLDEGGRRSLAEAFADDRAGGEEFLGEKRAVADRDRPKDIDLTLPGWGEWAGPGVHASARKRKRFVVRAPPGPPRRDQHLRDVIISELKDESISKHQISTLPFPYRNVDAFQSSISQPVGPDCNPVAKFRKAVKPRVITRLGAVIQPISKAETFKHQKQQRSSSSAAAGTLAGDHVPV